MAKHIIIATHALLAKGFNETMRFIVEPNCYIHTICAFTEEKNPEESIVALLDSISKNDTIVVLTDLLAGSVNKILAGYLKKYNFYLISGINLAVLLELALCDEKLINSEFIKNVIALAKEDMVYVNEKVETLQNDEEDFF